MRMVQREILEKKGYEIVGEANDGEEAIQMYTDLRPDVIILDITMPKMNGLSALREIKNIEPKARIVMCSALGQQQLILEAIKFGVKDFIVKPFAADRILNAIDKALR